MSGLRKRIRRELPQSWETVLKKHKLINKFVEYCYLSLPDYMKGSKMTSGRRGYILGTWKIQHLFKNTQIYNCFQGQYINIDSVNWYDIWTEILVEENKYQ